MLIKRGNLSKDEGGMREVRRRDDDNDGVSFQ